MEDDIIIVRALEVFSDKPDTDWVLQFEFYYNFMGHSSELIILFQEPYLYKLSDWKKLTTDNFALGANKNVTLIETLDVFMIFESYTTVNSSKTFSTFSVPKDLIIPNLIEALDYAVVQGWKFAKET